VCDVEEHCLRKFAAHLHRLEQWDRVSAERVQNHAHASLLKLNVAVPCEAGSLQLLALELFGVAAINVVANLPFLDVNLNADNAFCA
jgi:hypothetical protein